jgi:hypothetical protein
MICTTEFVTALLALARDGDKKLRDLFEASYDGNTYNEETFDNSFFIENVEILLGMDEGSDKDEASSASKSSSSSNRTSDSPPQEKK